MIMLEDGLDVALRTPGSRLHLVAHRASFMAFRRGIRRERQRKYNELTVRSPGNTSR